MPDTATINAGATAWVLASTALVFLMTPGLAVFYGGMVRAKNVLGLIMQNFTALAIVGVVWVVAGFSLAFGGGGELVGDFRYLGLGDLTGAIPGFEGSSALVIPSIVFVGFQLMFAAITPALITGATAERWRFASFVPFIALWTVLVYAPIAHWTFSPIGWLAKLGALDFAGGTVVHCNAGAAALAMALILRRRRGWPIEPMRPHNLPLVMLGTGLLWFGWFGFNAGSALNSGTVAGYALVNTNTAACAALLGWIAVEKIRYGKPTSLGAASGAVSGLVAITPCAGYVSPIGALALGLFTGAVVAGLVSIKSWLGLDDALDVVAVHLGAGAIGSIGVGLFATTTINRAGADGLFYGGGYRLLGVQVVAVLATAGFSFVVTALIGGFLDRIVGNRVPARVETAGLDLAVHGESAYEAGIVPGGTALIARPGASPAAEATADPTPASRPGLTPSSMAGPPIPQPDRPAPGHAPRPGRAPVPAGYHEDRP